MVTLDDTAAITDHGLVDRMLDVVDQRADLAGRLGGLLRQRLHLARDHREAAPGGAGARRFDGGIECKQRGLGGDAFDQLDDGADAAGGGREAANGAVGAAELVDGAVGRDLGGGDLAARARDQRQQLARGIRDRADVARGDFRGAGGVCGARVHVLVAVAEVGGGDLDLLAGLVEGRDQLLDRRAEALGEERAAGVVQLGLGLVAALVDDERVGVDQRLPHPFGGGGDVGHGAAAGALRQRGIAVAGGDEPDRIHHRPQPPLDPPGGDSAAATAAASPAIQLPVSVTVATGRAEASRTGSKSSRRNGLTKLKFHRKMNFNEFLPASEN